MSEIKYEIVKKIGVLSKSDDETPSAGLNTPTPRQKRASWKRD